MSKKQKSQAKAEKIVEPVRSAQPAYRSESGPQAAYRRAQLHAGAGAPLGAAADLLALQRTVGNRRVQQMMARRMDRTPASESSGIKVQTSPAAGKPGDIQRQGFTSSISFRQRLFSRQFHLDPGKSLTASINAHRSPEGCQMPANFVAHLYNVAEKKYETAVNYPTDTLAQYTWKGLKGGAYQFIFVFTENVSEGCTLTGTLDVQQEAAANRIVPVAQGYVGSTAWAIDANRPPYGSGTNKCNLFVYEALNEAGASVSMIERTRWGISRGKHPPLAGQWADPGFGIAGWTVVSGTPKPGDVVAEAHEYADASGHVGIVSSVSADGSTGTTVSAATSGSVVENDWGFRSGQNVVFRRYAGR